MTVKSTGTIKIAKPVAASIPPITVQPIVCLAIAPAPVANAKGETPSINAREVISIGRSLSLTADVTALRSGMPWSTRTFANSTISIAFFAARPINATSPICA